MDKPLLDTDPIDTIDPLDKKELSIPLLGGDEGGGGGGENPRRTSAPHAALAQKLLSRNRADDIEEWVRAWKERRHLHRELKRACKGLKISKASVIEWLDLVQVGEVGRSLDGVSRRSSGEGGGLRGHASAGDGDHVNDVHGGGSASSVQELEDPAWRQSVIVDLFGEQLENLYEDVREGVRDMYNIPRRWPGKGKVRWIQGYGSGYALKYKTTRSLDVFFYVFIVNGTCLYITFSSWVVLLVYGIDVILEYEGLKAFAYESQTIRTAWWILDIGFEVSWIWLMIILLNHAWDLVALSYKSHMPMKPRSNLLAPLGRRADTSGFTVGNSNQNDHPVDGGSGRGDGGGGSGVSDRRGERATTQIPGTNDAQRTHNGDEPPDALDNFDEETGGGVDEGTSPPVGVEDECSDGSGSGRNLVNGNDGGGDGSSGGNSDDDRRRRRSSCCQRSCRRTARAHDGQVSIGRVFEWNPEFGVQGPIAGHWMRAAVFFLLPATVAVCALAFAVMRDSYVEAAVYSVGILLWVFWRTTWNPAPPPDDDSPDPRPARERYDNPGLDGNDAQTLVCVVTWFVALAIHVYDPKAYAYDTWSMSITSLDHDDKSDGMSSWAADDDEQVLGGSFSFVDSMLFWIFCVGFYVGQFILWAYVVVHMLARFIVVLSTIRKPLSVRRANVIFGVTIILVVCYVTDTALLGVKQTWTSWQTSESDTSSEYGEDGGFVTALVGAVLLVFGWSHYFIIGTALCEGPVGEATVADPKAPTVYKLVQYELCQIFTYSMTAFIFLQYMDSTQNKSTWLSALIIAYLIHLIAIIQASSSRRSLAPTTRIRGAGTEHNLGWSEPPRLIRRDTVTQASRFYRGLRQFVLGLCLYCPNLVGYLACLGPMTSIPSDIVDPLFSVLSTKALTESMLAIELLEDCGGTISLRGALPVPADSVVMRCMPANVRAQEAGPEKHKPQRTSRGAAFLFGFVMLVVKGLWLSSIVSTTTVQETAQDISESVADTSRNSYDIYHLDRLAGGESAVANPICSREFLGGMTVHDVAYLAQMSYLKDGLGRSCVTESDMGACLANYFRPQGIEFNVTKIGLPGLSKVHGKQRATSQAAYFAAETTNLERNIGVIGIRGTSDARDWFEDLTLWSDVAILQMVSLVVPLVYVWPQTWTAEWLRLASVRYVVSGESTESYYSDVEDFYQNVFFQSFKSRNPNATSADVMFVGHSLGGGLAHILGARNGVRSVGLEPPGVALSYKKFGFVRERYDRTAVSLQRDYDLVPQVDRQGGEVAHVPCDKIDYTHCHLLRPLMCQLRRECDLPGEVTYLHNRTLQDCKIGDT